VQLLEDIVSRLLSTSTRAEPHAAPPTPPSAHRLFLDHRGNLRDALRELYDWYARQPNGCAG